MSEKMEPGKETKCRGCGAKMIFLMGTKGHIVPMTPVRTVYIMGQDMFGNDEIERLEDDRPKYISHFESCPNANDYSKGAKR